MIDVGGNHGQWASRLRQCGWGGPIVSFEPIKSIALWLETEAKNDPLWTVYATALGASNNNQTIHVAANEGAASSLLIMSDRVHQVDCTAKIINSEVVTVRRLDEIGCVQLHDNIFLKADVQGYELEVLKGSEGIITQVVGMELELSLIPLYESQPTISSMLSECEEMGFTPVQIRNGFVDPKNGQLLQVDVLFTRYDYNEND